MLKPTQCCLTHTVPGLAGPVSSAACVAHQGGTQPQAEIEGRNPPCALESSIVIRGLYGKVPRAGHACSQDAISDLHKSA